VINFEKTETEILTCNKLSQQLSDLLGHEVMIEKNTDLNYLD
jgi:predicted nucleotidyltransferase